MLNLPAAVTSRYVSLCISHAKQWKEKRQILKTFNCLWLFWNRDQEHLLINSCYKRSFKRRHEHRESVSSRSRLLHERGQAVNEGDPSTGQCPHHPGHHTKAPRLATGPPTIPATRCRVGDGLHWSIGSVCLSGGVWWAEQLKPVRVLRALAQSNLTLS